MEEKSIYKKIAQVQESIGTLTKSKENPYFKSKYLDINGLLDTLNPELHKEGLMILQPLTHVDGKPAIKTIVIDVENEEPAQEPIQIEYDTILPETIDPQKAGSAITYFRRYALVSLFALPAEDDDANVASGKVEEEPKGTRRI